MKKSISWNSLRAAEIKASLDNKHISRVIRPDGGEIEIVKACKALTLVRKRQINAHKGTYGRIVIVAGSDQFPGAAHIATLAALRSGVGLVRVFSTASVCASLAVSAKEATLFPCQTDGDGFIASDDKTINALSASAKQADAVLIGCGLGTSDGALKLLETVLECADCPIIIDADGINLVSSRIELLRKARQDIILTPHPAELSRLAGVSLQEAIEKRYILAKSISDEYGVIVAAKSCATVIVSQNRDVVVMSGNDGLSKGGSGDLLAGLTASFAAQGILPENAVLLGCAVLGTACEEVSKRLSKTGMLASDIIDYLPKLFKKFERV